MGEKNTKPKDNYEHKRIARNSLYSFLSSFTLYAYAILSSALLARMYSQQVWGYLIIATSFTSLVVLILSFSPPGLDLSLIYFLPKYKTQKLNNKLKSFALKSFTINFIVVITFFIVVLIIITVLSDVLSINLGSYVYLLYLLSPIILIRGFNFYLNSFNLGFSKFKLNFILNSIKFSFHIIALFLYFLFFQVYSIDTIVIIEIIAYLIPFLINFIIFVITLLKIKPTKEEKLSYKETIKQIVSYGSITSTQSVLGQVWKETEVQAVGAFESAAVVTGFNTGNHYGDIPRLFSNSLKNPLMISFTSLYSKGELEKINKIVKIITIYSLFIILIVSGIVFLLTDFYLALVLGETFLIYSDLIKLIIISIIFGIEFSILTLLLRSSDKVRFLPLTLVIYYAIRISGFFIGLIFFGIVGAIIGLTIGNAISFVLSYLLIRKMFKITTNLFKIISLYISFAFSLIVAIVLGDLFFNSITFSLLESLNLSFFKYVPFFELLIFFFLDMGLIIIFKSLTKRDIEYVLSIFTKDKLTHKVIRKWLKTLKKIFR